MISTNNVKLESMDESSAKEEEIKLLCKKSSESKKDVNLSKRKPSKVTLPISEENLKHAEFFGVRSYLHNFYESVTVKNPQMYEDIYEDDLAYMSHSRKRRLRFCRGFWRIAFSLGLVLLVVGLIFLLFGYLMPHHGVVAGFREDMEIIDINARKYNELLNLCRIIGLVMFCSGGVIFCLALLLPVMINFQVDEDNNREPFQVMFAPEAPPRSPTDKKIPATEELASIQPKREAVEEVVMTNSGLCKVPIREANP